MEVVFVSPSLLDILGSSDPMSFDSWFAHVHPEDADRIAKATGKVPESDHLDETLRILHPKKSEVRWVQIVSSGVSDPGGTLRYMNGTIIDITERKWMEEQLAEREKELAFKSEKLEEVNIALRVLLKKREEDRIGLEDKIIANINELILPHLEKAKNLVSDKKSRIHLEIIDENLKEIVSPFAQKLTSPSFNLTPTEIQVAHLVKHGYSTKAIAEQLNVSHKTVEVHRLNIRKKFGIARKKANLRTFLLGLK